MTGRTRADAGNSKVPVESFQRWPLISVWGTRACAREFSTIGDGFCVAGGGTVCATVVADSSQERRRAEVIRMIM
jgi:hypothetical protein